MGRWSCYGDQDVELSVHQDQGRMNDVLRPVYTQVFIHSSFAILYLCIFLISWLLSRSLKKQPKTRHERGVLNLFDL